MSQCLSDNLMKDCSDLIQEFAEKKTTSFPSFLSVWKSRNFDLIYAGQNENEIDYFIFHIMHVAKKFCDHSKSDFEKVGGLYLLYNLYYTEPLKMKKSIRLTHDEFINLKNLADEYKSVNVEVGYAFYKLVLDQAFDYVITSLPFDETLIYYKEELKKPQYGSCEDSEKEATESVLNDTGFDKNEWSKLVNEYNSVKKKLNACSSLELPATKVNYQ